MLHFAAASLFSLSTSLSVRCVCSTWRGRTVLQSLLDIPPDLMSEARLMGMGGGPGMDPYHHQQNPGQQQYPPQYQQNLGRVAYIIPDRRHRFERLTLRGIELDLLLLDVLVSDPT